MYITTLLYISMNKQAHYQYKLALILVQLVFFCIGRVLVCLIIVFASVDKQNND